MLAYLKVQMKLNLGKGCHCVHNSDTGCTSASLNLVTKSLVCYDIILDPVLK